VLAGDEPELAFLLMAAGRLQGLCLQHTGGHVQLLTDSQQHIVAFSVTSLYKQQQAAQWRYPQHTGGHITYPHM
jgi:hypothetical protein